ncbi:MAG: hypothetical protein A2103_05505 [Gammaproteobacteria bacterium GWF2_41_13]|nr:MAG: hypothetical protein A2103_05505 [Gammaproteobacteria bacterium GWF2_41_13]
MTLFYRARRCIFLALLIFFSIQVNAAQRSIKRIITLSPHLAEIVDAAGAGHSLIGVSVDSNYPPFVRSLPVVADAYGCDYERIVALKPDLVIAWAGGNSWAEIHQLQTLHLPVHVIAFDHMVDIPQAILRVGQWAGTESAAKRFVSQFDQTFNNLQKRYAQVLPKKVFYQLSLQPLLTVTHRSMVSEVIEKCHGENIFGQAVGVAPQISMEDVIEKNPSVILVSEQAGDTIAIQQFWARYPQIDAVRDHRVVIIHSDLIERYGPRILQGMNEVCSAIASAQD